MEKTTRIVRSQTLNRPLDEVFEFFSNAENLGLLTPPFLKFKIKTPLPIEMKDGAIIEYSLSLFRVPVNWRTVITEWRPQKYFVDNQEKGPFAIWHHRHDFEERGDSVLMTDTVDYRAPLGPLGSIAQVLFVNRLVHKIFDFREKNDSGIDGVRAERDATRCLFSSRKKLQQVELFGPFNTSDVE